MISKFKHEETARCVAVSSCWKYELVKEQERYIRAEVFSLCAEAVIPTG